MENKKLTQHNVSKYTFTPNVLVFLTSIFFVFNSNTSFTVLLLIFAGNIAFFFPTFINFYFYKIMISRKKIFIRNKFLKTKIELDLVSNLCYFRYSQTIFGKIFNYGRVEFVDEQNRVVRIDGIENPKELEAKIVSNTNKYLKFLGIDEQITNERIEVISDDKETEKSEQQKEITNDTKTETEKETVSNDLVNDENFENINDNQNKIIMLKDKKN